MPATLTTTLALREVGTVRLRAAPKDRPRERRFSAVAYSGGALGGARFIDLSTLRIPKTPMPLMEGDKDNARIGVVEAARIEGGQLRIEGKMLTGSPEAELLVRDIASGFPMECAVHLSEVEWEKVPAGKRRTVNGRTVIGPAEVASNARLRAGLTVSVGLDEGTSMTMLSHNRTRPLRRPLGAAPSASKSAAKPKPRPTATPKPAPTALLSGGEFSPTALPSDPDRAWRGCVPVRAAFDSDREAFDRMVQLGGDWRRRVSDDATTLALAIADPAKTPAVAWEACAALREAEVAALCERHPDRKADDPNTIKLARTIFLSWSASALRDGESIFARLGAAAKKPGATKWQPPRRSVAGRSSRIEPLRERIGGGDSGVLLAALHLDYSDRCAALAGAGLRDLYGN